MTFATAKVGAVVIDCHDPNALFAFWSSLTGVDKVQESPGFIFCTELPGNHIRLAFQQVPEDKVTKNRLHLDMGHEDPEAFITHVESLGGSRLGDRQIGDFHWTVLADPEGNEFCVSPLH